MGSWMVTSAIASSSRAAQKPGTSDLQLRAFTEIWMLSFQTMISTSPLLTSRPLVGLHPPPLKPNIPPFQNGQSERDKRFNKKKSIRIVAAEHKKKIEDRISRAEAPSSVLRKRSTKLWGSKVEEVTAFPIPNLPATVPESPTAPNPKRESKIL